MDLHEQAGLSRAGKDNEGNEQWIGTREQWNLYESMEAGESWYRDRKKDVLEAIHEGENHDCKMKEKGYCDACGELTKLRSELRTMSLAEASHGGNEYSKDIIDYVEARNASVNETQIEHDFWSLK